MEKENKQTIICGTYHEMGEEEKTNFIKMMENNGEYNVIYDDKNMTPKIIESSLPFYKT